MTGTELMQNYKDLVRSAKLDLGLKLIRLLNESNIDPDLVLDTKVLLERFNEDHVLQLGSYKTRPVYIRKPNEDTSIEFYTDKFNYTGWFVGPSGPAGVPLFVAERPLRCKPSRSFNVTLGLGPIPVSTVTLRLINFMSTYDKTCLRWNKEMAKQKAIVVEYVRERNAASMKPN